MPHKEAIQKKFAEAQATVLELKNAIRSSEARSKGFEEAAALLGNDVATAQIRRKIEDKIKKEKQLKSQAEAGLIEAQGLLSAFEEAARLFDRDEDTAPELRAGSELYRVRTYILERKQPAELGELLNVLGKQDTPETRNSLRGSLSRYARTGSIFVKTAPNTFGLLELDHKEEDPLSASS